VTDLKKSILFIFSNNLIRGVKAAAIKHPLKTNQNRDQSCAGEGEAILSLIY